MSRLLAYLLLVGVAGLGLIAAACGDSDEDAGATLTLDQYFTELAVLVGDLSDVNNTAFIILNESDDLDELKAAFESLPAGTEVFLTGMEGLEPAPEEVTEEHASAVDDGHAYLDMLNDVNDDVQATETVDEFVETGGNDELQALVEEFNAHCAVLQGIADENSVPVDLTCPE